MKSILFTGVSGVGKSTIVRAVSAELNLPHSDYADFIIALLPEISKDDIPLLPWERRQQIYRDLDQIIDDFFREGPPGSSTDLYILENHLSVISEGAVKAFELSQYRKYNMCAICVIKSDPSIISARRVADSTRKRRRDTITLIERQQSHNSCFAQQLSSAYSIPYVEFENPPGSPPIDHIVRWVKSISLTNRE